jgi:hypothetical protein
MYWQYTTAPAGALAAVTPASPIKALISKSANFTEPIERRSLCMVSPPDFAEYVHLM